MCALTTPRLSPPTQSKDKARKWLHAIGIVPIPYMTLEALVEEPADCSPSPYQGFGGGEAKRAAASGGADDGGWVVWEDGLVVTLCVHRASSLLTTHSTVRRQEGP